MTEMDMDDIMDAYDKAGDEDEIVKDGIDMSEVESELKEMEKIHDGMVHDEEHFETPEVTDPYMKMKKMHEEMGAMLKEMDDMKKDEEMVLDFDSKMKEMYGESYKDSMDEGMYESMYEMYKKKHMGEGDMSEMDEMHQGKFDAAKHNANLTPQSIEEEKSSEDMDEDREHGKDMDEIHGVSFSAGKVRSGSLPNDGAGYRDRDGHSRNRGQWSNESLQKRVESLLAENKKLTKSLNEKRSELNEANTLIKEQSQHLGKAKKKITEMAVFNTNLALSNNILIEGENLTRDEKAEVVSQFKNANTISKSKSIHESLLKSLKEDTNKLNESIEDTITEKVIGESSANKLEEKEKPVLTEHVNRMKKLISYNHVK
jgi:hypothetical protein